MAQSNNKPSTILIPILDQMAQIGIAVGILIIFQPYWSSGLKVGFFVTLMATLLHIVTSHLVILGDR